MTPRERFYAKTERATTGCLLWTASTQGIGYGSFVYDGRTQRAHRVAYQIEVGPIPKGMILLHSCDQPSCVEVSHLRPGTQAENIAEARARGRLACQRQGYPNGAKLRPDGVRQIRVRLAAGDSRAAIAADFGVHVATIGDIRRGRRWSTVQ